MPKVETANTRNLALIGHAGDGKTPLGDAILHVAGEVPELGRVDDGTSLGFDGVGFWESNVAKKLAADERRRVHVMGREELVRLVRDAEPALIVFAEGTWQEVRVAARERYRLATTFGSIQILERRGADSVPGAR